MVTLPCGMLDETPNPYLEAWATNSAILKVSVATWKTRSLTASRHVDGSKTYILWSRHMLIHFNVNAIT
jgi:hypothetical protein